MLVITLTLGSFLYYYRAIPALVEKYNPLYHYILTPKEVIQDGLTLGGKRRTTSYTFEEIKYVVFEGDRVIFFKEGEESDKNWKSCGFDKDELNETPDFLILGLIYGPGIWISGEEEEINELLETVLSRVPLQKFEFSEDEAPYYDLYVRIT